MTQFCRFMHDPKLAKWNYAVRPMSGALTAETFALESIPKGDSKGDPIVYTDEWYNYDAALILHNWTMGVAHFLFNTGANDHRAESISTSGNVGEIDRTENNHGHLLSFINSISPDPSAVFDYSTYPQFIHKVTCIARDGHMTNPGAGVDAYEALIGNPDVWVNLPDVEMFPTIPMIVKVKWNTIPWLNVRAQPYGAKVGQLLPLQSVTIDKYDPRGSDVWGRIQGTNSWICLQKNMWFYTSWHMFTQPPIPPL
jgi:hypothetical protein